MTESSIPPVGDIPIEPVPPIAPPDDSRLPLLVIASGLFTTAVTLGIVWYVNANTEANVMGWYANYVIPIGALLVGLGSAAGYGIVSWITGVKIRRGLLLTILALQILAYFAAQYIEFRMLGPLVFEDTGESLGFFEFFHLNAISFAWIGKDGQPGEPLGMWGYAFRALEIGGFALGGLIVPLVLMKAPYCELCQRYMKTRQLASIPASATPKQIKKGLANAEEEAQKGQTQLAHLMAAAEAADAGTFNQLLSDLKAGRKAAEKLPAHIQVSMVHCQSCSGATLKSEMVTGQGNAVQRTPLSDLALSRDFVRQIQTT